MPVACFATSNSGLPGIPVFLFSKAYSKTLRVFWILRKPKSNGLMQTLSSTDFVSVFATYLSNLSIVKKMYNNFSKISINIKQI
jgi:hypothetical protein